MSDQHDLEPERVAELLRAEAQVVDVREPQERAEAHIAGTTHIPLGDLTAAAESLDRDREIVFYCRTGARSGMATQAFRASGYEAYNMRGGIELWAERGLPVESE